MDNPSNSIASPSMLYWPLVLAPKVTMQQRLVLVLLPVAMIMAAAATIGYFIWWDATHCVLCRARLDKLGRCPNPDCHLGPLTQERAPARA